MVRVLFVLLGVALALGSGSWAIATVRMRRLVVQRRRHGVEPPRAGELLTRDVLVTVLLALVAIATVAEAFDDGVSVLDAFRALVLLPIAASLPFIERYQGHAELRNDDEDERERQRLALLYEVAAAGEDLDLSAAAQRLADALRPTLGDWGIVLLLDRAGGVDALAVSHSDDPRDAVVEDMLRRYPVDLEPERGLGLAVRSGDRVVYDDITDDLLAESARDEAHLEMLRALEMGCAVVEPMTARGRRVGAIGVVTRRGRSIDEHAAALLAEVAKQAAPVLDNSRLHHELHQTSRALRFSEAVLRAQGESGVEGLLVVSPEGEMLSHNSRFAEMWGFSEEDMASGLDDDALAAAMDKLEDPEGFISRIRAVYANPEAPTRDELHFRDGRVFDRYGAPLRSDDDTYLGWAWYFRDITHERRVQQSLLESGERFASLARTLQESLLPPDMPDIDGAEVAARYHPAGDGSEIGGDFYDVFQIGEAEWCAVMGDVCGKGAPAARLTALARYTLRAAAIRSPSLTRNFEILNVALVRQAEIDRRRGENRFATASMIRFFPDTTGLKVRAGSGGHPPPLIVRTDGTVEAMACRGALLGVFDEVRFQPAEDHLGQGDLVVLYTDGVTEARRGTEEFGEERLLDLLRRSAGMSAVDLTAAIENAVIAFQDGDARDDIAVLAVRAVDVEGAQAAGDPAAS